MSKLCKTRRLVGTIACSLLGLGSVGCGPQFDPPSKLQSLRILAVKKADPYLRPASSNAGASTATESGDGTVPDSVAHLSLALVDARRPEQQQGPIQKLWFGGCNNPLRDNYFTCLLNVWLSFKVWSELGPYTDRGPRKLPPGEGWPNQQDLDQIGPVRLMQFLRDTFPDQFDTAAGATAAAGASSNQQELLQQAMALRIGTGDTFDYSVPSWVIEKHAPPDDPDLPRYGLSQVFLAACDGEIGISPDWETVKDPLEILTDATRGFPLTCYERENPTKERGPDHFMVSYSNLYVYDELTNQNPVIDGFEFDGKPVDPSARCIGVDCQSAPEISCDAATLAPRVKSCDADRDKSCKKHRIKPILDESKNAEFDTIASRVGGGDAKLREQMWIRYYADLGEVARDTKRLRDPSDGWYSEHHTEWSAPKPGSGSGVANVWSVVYDNRGGVDWARVSVCIDE